MKYLLILASLFAGTVAHAEPAATASTTVAFPGYVAVGGQLDGTLGFDDSITIDIGYRVRSSPWFVHGGVGFGAANYLSEALGSETMAFYRGDTHFTRGRVGVEYDTCTTSGIVCGLAGLDASLVWSQATTGPWADTPSARYTEQLLTPLVGVDVGGHHLRLRTTVGLDLGLAERSEMTATTTSGVMGMELGTALVYRF